MTGKPSKSKTKPRRGQAYHHGNLRQALIDATLALIEEHGLERATVREAAKRAGVSSGAPFRHFPNRKALMTAVAEEAQQRLATEIEAALAAEKSGDPLVRLRAIGTGYLRWVQRNPTHFQVISDRTLIDFGNSPGLKRENDKVRGLMASLLTDAAKQGALASDDIGLTVLMTRATAYGLARMLVDGQYPSWDVPQAKIAATMNGALDLLMDGLRKPR
jgi:AcrR family transcriptional regulator